MVMPVYLCTGAYSPAPTIVLISAKDHAVKPVPDADVIGYADRLVRIRLPPMVSGIVDSLSIG